MRVAVLLLLLAALLTFDDAGAQMPPERTNNNPNKGTTPAPSSTWTMPSFLPINEKGKYRCEAPAVCSVSSLRVQFFGIEGSDNFTTSNLVLPPTTRVVQISRTSFSGRLDEEFIRKLANVSVLDLSDNRLEGTLPSSIGLLTNLRALTIDGNFFYGRVPNLSGLSNLQVCVLSGVDDTNTFCCPPEAEMPPMAACRCHSAPSCSGAPTTLTYTQLLRLWAVSARLQMLAMRRAALQALITLLTEGEQADDEDEEDSTTVAEDKRVTVVSNNGATAASNFSGNGKSEKPSTRKVNAKLVDSKGRVVAFELDDGTIAQVRRTELASDGSIAGYELEDGSFIAASDATDAKSKSSGLSKQTIIIIGAVSGGVLLVLCIAGAFVLFHWQQRATDDDDDDDLTAAAAAASPVDDGFGMFGGTDDMREQATDAELRPVKRARKHHAPRQDAHAIDALDLPGTLASPIGAPRQHGSDEGLLAPKHSSGDSLPGAATRANLAGYVAPPSSGTTGWNHGSDEALKAPKHSSGDAMPGAQTRADLMLYVPGAEVDEQSVLDGTPQLYFSPGKDSSPLESPFGDNYEDRPGSSSDHGLYEGSSSSSSGEQRLNGFQLYLHDNGHDEDDSHGGAISTPALESASASEAAKTRGTKRRAANNSKAAEQHFSNIKLPNELKPARKKKPAHLRKHKNPVEDFDNIVLPAEMRGRKTVVVDDEA